MSPHMTASSVFSSYIVFITMGHTISIIYIPLFTLRADMYIQWNSSKLDTIGPKAAQSLCPL